MSTVDNLKKKCTICEYYKEIHEFYKKKKGKYGIGSQCKECIKLEAKLSYVKYERKLIEPRLYEYKEGSGHDYYYYKKHRPKIRACSSCKEYLEKLIICPICKTVNEE